MTSRQPASLAVPLRPTGVMLAISGVTVAAFVPFHPSILGGRDLAEVVRGTPAWRGIHLALTVACILTVFGATGIVALHRGRLGRPGLAALFVTVIGSAVMACAMFGEAVVFPELARHAPELLTVDSPVTQSPWIVGLTGLALGYPMGLIAIGLIAARAGEHRAAGWTLAWSSAAFMMLEGLFLPVLGVLSTLAFGVAQVWWAWLLVQPECAQKVQVMEPPPRAPAGGRLG